VLPLSFHTDEDDLSPLVEVEIGPIDRSKQNVRLVEVLLKITSDGRFRVEASVRATQTSLPVRVVRGRSGMKVPTEIDSERSTPSN